MYFKLALGNVKKSFKEYGIYFLTLTLAVCIFYSFNSIESQKSLIDIKGSKAEYVVMLTKIIYYLSIFIAVILGLLIIYANNFLIKKRKKELGIYMALGMGKHKISKILIMETIIVGVVSLISGLLLGIVTSQGLSMFTTKLFEVNMSEYKFLISISSIFKTILYFGIMFLVVILFNTFVISKYKVIDLIMDCKKNEKIKTKSKRVYIIFLLISLVFIVCGYNFILDVGFDISKEKFFIAIVLGILGTILFFFSFGGFLLMILKKNNYVYLKKLNIFTIKQINSKVNTNFISMSVICLMLFMTISILSTSISFNNIIQKNLRATTPFDATLRFNANTIDLENPLVKKIKFNNDEQYVVFDDYMFGTKARDILNKGFSNKITKEEKLLLNADVRAIQMSKYNKIRKMQNKKTIRLNENEVFILSNQVNMVPLVNNFLKNNNKIIIKNKKYIVKNNKANQDAINNNKKLGDKLILVFNDKRISKGKFISSGTFINLNFKYKDKDKINKRVEELSGEIRNLKTGDYRYVLSYTKEEVYVANKGNTIIILFIGIYLGIVFLISSMGVLALQQLSQASDSIDRYNSLRRIGASENNINKTIFTQIFIYFSFPIILAGIHSIVAIKVISNFLELYNKPDIISSTVVTLILFTIVYIGYFYLTYTTYKNIVKKS